MSFGGEVSDLRTLLEQALDQVSEDTVRELVREAFTFEKSKELWVPIDCKHCRRTGKYKVEVQIPDYRERTKAIEILLNQAKGRPRERMDLNVRLTTKIDDMNMQELQAEEQRILNKHPHLNR